MMDTPKTIALKNHRLTAVFAEETGALLSLTQG